MRLAFENFELRERFYEGQTFLFGITRSTPEQLAIRTKESHSPLPHRSLAVASP
jgi:hypothetical protein